MTIDELARRTRTTTRTLRLYQTRALLPPPRIVGRVGYYTELHVNRLLLIERLQARGFSLAGIAELLKTWEEGKGLNELFGFEAQLMHPWNEEQEQEFTVEEFETRWPDLHHDPDLLQKVIELGVLERRDDGGYRVISPTLLLFGQELVSKGVPVQAVLEQLQMLRVDCHAIAERFFKLFRTHVLPQMVAGGPMEWLPRLANYSMHLRPAVRNVMLAIFTTAMDEVVRGGTGSVVPPVEDELPPEED